MGGSADSRRGTRAWARDLAGAIALVEGAVSQRILIAVEALELPARPAANAFGETVVVERGSDVADLVRRAMAAASEGERVAIVARAADLAIARNELAAVSAQRLGIVVHAIAEPARDGRPASLAGLAPALALDDLFWGMLIGSGVADAIDLALIARRAAEDSGCPFFVVHEASHAHDIEPVASPSRELCEAFIGSASVRLRRASEPAGASSPIAGDRAFAERVPFALGSAMRELEAITGRHHDVIERAPAVDAPVGLVGTGALGDSLIADAERLRASGNDVVAVRVVSWRPFPAPRLVRALGRALSVTVLEHVDQPLASSAPLANQLKAAFSDALTWAPDYPGIGRIPRIVSGLVAPGREVDSTDLDAIVHNVLADERGKRTFVLGGDEAQSLWTPPAKRSAVGAFVMRGICAQREVAVASAELCAAVLASALGLRTRVTVRDLSAEEGGGVAFDVVAGSQRPRGSHAPHAVGLVVLASQSLLEPHSPHGRPSRHRQHGDHGDDSERPREDQGNPLARLAAGGVVAVPSERRAAEGIWAEMPPWAKAVVFDLGARVVGWSPPHAGDDRGQASEHESELDRQQAPEDAWVTAAAFVGIALALASGSVSGSLAAPPIDGQVVEREVGEALRVGVASHAQRAGAVAVIGGVAARSAFESIVEVPRTLIDREDDGVRLGRRRPPVSPA
jgi:pyruvate-ferredoxin/flavodoxin oxidoreductase